MSFYIQIVGRRRSSFLIAETRIKNYLPRRYTMPLSLWKLRDYERQWKEGIERLKTHATSCLMLSVWKDELVFLALYKQGDEVIIMQCEHGEYARPFPESSCTLANCYEYIPPYKPRKYREELLTHIASEGYLEEWVTPLKDILATPLLPWDKTNRFFIHAIPPGYPAGIGFCREAPYHIEIAVGEFADYFSTPFQYWNKKQFEHHWKEAFERLETEKLSCFVHSITKKDGALEVSFVPLYKTKNKVFLELCWNREGYIKKTITAPSFTPENCYEYLLPATGKWYPLKDVVYRFISLKDMLKGVEKSFPLQVSRTTQRITPKKETRNAE